MADQKNPESLNESSPPTQENKTKTKLKMSYVVKGLILCIGVFLLWAMIAPQFKSCGCRSNGSYIRSDLYNVYLSCRLYWEVNGSESVCNSNVIAGNPDYEYSRSKGVEIATLGNESNFIAYAVHTKDSLVYKMTLSDDHNKPYDIQLATGSFTQKKINEIGLNISSAKRDLVYLIFACSDYWEKNGKHKNCTPEVAAKTNFRYPRLVGEGDLAVRYIPSPDVVITAQGNKLNFIAQAESKEDGRKFRWKSSDFTVDKIKEVFPWSWVFFWE